MQKIFGIQLIQNLAPCIFSAKDTGWEFQRSLRELQLLIHLKFEFQIRDGHLDPSDFMESPTRRILCERLKNLSENFSLMRSSGQRQEYD